MSSRTRILFLALVLGAFGWRVQGLANQSLWRDEVDAILFATRELPYTLDMFIHPGQNGALFFLALRPWFTVVGTSEFALRYVSAMAGTVSVALLWQMTARLASLRPSESDAEVEKSTAEPAQAEAGAPVPAAIDEQSGGDAADDGQPGWNCMSAVPFLAALFLACNPYQLWYSQEGKMYTVVLALVLTAALFFWRGVTTGGWRPWLGFFVSVTVAIYTHLLLIMLYPFFFLWFLIAWPQSKRHWRGYGLVMAGLILPYLPMVVWQWDMLTAGSKVTGFSFTPLTEMLRVIVFNHSRGFMADPDLVWLTPIFFLFLAGLIFGVGEFADRRIGRDDEEHCGLAPWRRFTLLVVWLLAPIAMVHAMSLRQPIFTDRYLFWIAAPAMVFMALARSWCGGMRVRCCDTWPWRWWSMWSAFGSMPAGSRRRCP